jgi:glycosyltransferase involved in cell wall biosynthesis
MEHKRLQFLVPQYKETEDVIKFLLDSIECQVEIDKKDIGMIICSDGGEYILDKKFLKKYSYDIDYVICKHRGVSATRNSALLLSDADYVMFCDSDDGFCNTFAIKIIFENINISEKEGKPFDLMSSKFYTERPAEEDKPWAMSIVDHNNVYIHSRVYKRDFLIKNNLYFNENIWANEDSFFNISTNFFSKNTKMLNVPIYCWRGNPLSVTHDPKYIIKTLHQLIYSNDSVIEMMILLNKDKKDIAKSAFDIICKVYLDMNKPEWHTPENAEYKDITIKTLQWYINKRGTLCEVLSDADKKDILQSARKTQHYGNIELITFNDFIKGVMNYGKQN